VLSSGGLLSQPRGVGLEADGSLVVAGSGSVVRIDAASGAQSLVSTGGNLAALGGIAVDDCTGDLFTAERGVTGGTPALVRIHPGTGAQSVVSTGNHLIEPLGVSLVAGTCESLPLIGTALGGSVGVVIDQTHISVTTTPGQSLAEILTALALAIRNHPTLESAGIAATVSGNALQVRGDTLGLYAVNNDGGLTLGPSIPNAPALSAGALATLAALLAAAAVLALQSRLGPWS
jgi:hypothetical protein